ncbi:hypothetical protein yfred0001_7010 [Yersinia frederiksenii ATCC 33641]|nr:hypothetical protein yfred0001_7010 [Yersinia frederiksenii ATCC 33641]
MLVEISPSIKFIFFLFKIMLFIFVVENGFSVELYFYRLFAVLPES